MGLGPPSPVYRGEGHRGGISCLSVLGPLTFCRGPSCLVKFVYLSASSILEPGTRQLVAFSSCLARVAEVSSAVLPTLVPARTAVLTTGRRIRCGCGRCLCALRCGRCGHLPVLPAPFSRHLPHFVAVLCSAPRQRAERAHFLYCSRVLLP